MKSMGEFLSHLDKNKPLKILDVGSCLAVGQTDTYRNFITSKLWKYVGLDLYQGNNVDIVANDPFNYPFNDSTFDVIISGQCIEHNANPFRWVREISRILKPGGKVCFIGPSKGKIHRSPPTTYDYWRILPDGMEAILKNAGFTNIKVRLSEDSPWGDCVGIGEKP